MKQKIELNLPANLSYSSLIRHIADEVFASVGFVKEWSNRLKLVVDELFMNAVKYGSTENTSVVKILFSYDDQEIEFRVEDDGTGVGKVSADQLRTIVENNKKNNAVTNTSGRGLALITNLWTDKLDIERGSNGGIVISFSKKLETTPPPPPTLVQAAVQQQADVTTPTSPEPKKPEVKRAEYMVKLHGEIDQHNIEVITQPVTEQVNALPENSKLILDFTDVVYINSTFIGHLASWYNEVAKKNSQISIKNANNQVKDVLDLVGLGRVITLVN
ncbi:anti-sigma factor antagonist [Patescibacteria group bacterium]|nr:anti-sigma factor antagonist [Patescibacteria group bacterium]